MKNGIKIQDFDGVVSEIPLNSKEMQLALDKSKYVRTRPHNDIHNNINNIKKTKVI